MSATSPLNQALQDKDFLASPDEQKIKYLSSIDQDFAKAPPDQQKSYLAHITGGQQQQTTTPPPASAANRFATSALGLPAGQTAGQTVDATVNEIKHPLDTKVPQRTLSMLDPYSGYEEARNTGIADFNKPGFMNKVTGGLEYLESGIPFIGSSMVRSGKQFQSGDIAGGAGTLAPIAVGAALTPSGRGAIGDATSAVKDTAGGIRDTMGDSIRDERTGKLKPAVRTMARVGGGAAGYGVAGYPGGVGGAMAGPALLDALLPESETSRIGRMQSAARRIDPTETARAQKAQGIPIGKPSPFGPPSEEGVPGGLPRPSDRLVLLPSEARATNVLQDLATQRASQRGMQYAAGMRPVGNNIPRSATRTSTIESPGPRESINYGRLGEAGISPEAVNRPGVAYKVSPSGVSYLGKDIDASLKPNEAVVRIMPDGKMQVVNSNGLADSEVLKRYGDKIKNARSSR